MFSFPLVWDIWGQSNQTPSFKVQSDVTLVDLIVTDEEGRFISDLRQEEVTLLVKKKPQEIAFFRLHSTGSVDSTSTGPTKASMITENGKRATTTVPPESDSKARLVFLLDLPTLIPDALLRVKNSIRSFLPSRMEAGDKAMLAVVDHELFIRQNFTSRFSEFDQALEESKSRFDLQIDFNRFMDQVTVSPSLRSVQARGRFFLTRLGSRVRDATGAIYRLSSLLAFLPGRKNVLFFSGGYTLNPAERINEAIDRIYSTQEVQESGGFNEQDFFQYLREAVNRANQSQVSFYTIDARGLLTGTPDTSVRTVPGIGGLSGIATSTILQRSGSINATQGFLKSLSMDTGGITLVNSNNLDKGLPRFYQDSSRYYLIGYVPSQKQKPGAYRPIRIKVSRPGVKIRYRRGTFAGRSSPTVDSQYLTALTFPGLYQDFPLQVVARPQEGKLLIQILIPTRALDFQRSDGQRVGSVELRGALVDESGQWVGEQYAVAQNLHLRFSPMDLLRWLSRHEHALVEAEIDAPPGDYRLIVAARQSLNGRLSAHEQTLHLQKDKDRK